jgi:hypothetical protein
MATSSFEKINYNLRPNKCIERKMMCEALGRLSFLEHLHKYRYIGFGSPYFADFILFHKNLGIKDLVSIEKEEGKKNRFEFNIPYSGIKMHYGQSETILPNLQLELKKNILWLDYDDRISTFMFSDVDTFFFNTKPGSFFILSVNVEEERMSLNSTDLVNKATLKEFRLNELINRIGKDRLPNEYSNLLMTTKNLTAVTYEMINRQIATTLINRNGANENKISYKQLFNFTYRDSTTILTIGGIIFDDSQENQINKMDFNNLSFIKNGEESYKIQSPNLTFREIKALDKALPDSIKLEKGKFLNKKLQSIPLIQSDIENYAKIYRYYPNFTETNL